MLLVGHLVFKVWPHHSRVLVTSAIATTTTMDIAATNTDHRQRHRHQTSLPTCAFVVFLLAVMASVGNAMHMSFHVKGFHLEKYDWYMELRALHVSREF